MCNYLYYRVTVRNSQSYWHLEHVGGGGVGELACTRGGGGGGGGGGEGSARGVRRWADGEGGAACLWSSCLFTSNLFFSGL